MSNRTKKEVKNELRDLKRNVGESPTISDVMDSSREGLLSDARKHFGSWNSAKEAAGLETYSKGRPSRKYNEDEFIETLNDLGGAANMAKLSSKLDVVRQTVSKYIEEYDVNSVEEANERIVYTDKGSLDEYRKVVDTDEYKSEEVANEGWQAFSQLIQAMELEKDKLWKKAKDPKTEDEDKNLYLHQKVTVEELILKAEYIKEDYS